MKTTSIRTATVAALAATTAAVCGASAAAAPAATPLPGEWSGNQGTTFEVDRKGVTLTGFRARCFPIGLTLKVKSNRFKFNRKMGLQGGKARRLRISGSFTSDREAKGTVKYGKCSVKFTAKALNVPEPPPAPEPEPAPEPQEAR